MSDPSLAQLQAPLMIRAAVEYLADTFGLFRDQLPEHEDTSWTGNATRCRLLAGLIASSRSVCVQNRIRELLRTAGPVQVAADLRVPCDGPLAPATTEELSALRPALVMLQEAMEPEGEAS